MATGFSKATRLDDEVEAATVDLVTASAQMQAEIEEARTSLDFAKRELDPNPDTGRKGCLISMCTY